MISGDVIDCVATAVDESGVTAGDCIAYHKLTAVVISGVTVTPTQQLRVQMT